MSNRYSRKAVFQALEEKARVASDNVYRTSRPLAKITERMKDFIVIRLPQGITPYADTHNISYVQFLCFTKDRQEGIEDTTRTEGLIEAVSSLFPFNDTLISCNDTPIILQSKGDGMGFHSTIIQFRIVIKV